MLMMSVPTQDPEPYDPDQLMTMEQVSRLFQVSIQTVRNQDRYRGVSEAVSDREVDSVAAARHSCVPRFSLLRLVEGLSSIHAPAE